MPHRRQPIIEQLDRFLPSDTQEKADREAMVGLLDDEAALSRYHYDPGHMTASGFVLNGPGTHVVLVDHPKIGRWLQPGGHVEPEDVSLEVAARREIEEETGLTGLSAVGLFDLDIHEFPERPDQPSHLHFDVRFAFRSTSDEIPGGEHTAEWVPLDRAREWNYERSILRPVSKLASLAGDTR